MSSIRRSSRFFTTITRYRRVAGSYVEGVWVDGARSSSSITASVQPGGGPQDLARVPEGLRTRDVVKIFTDDDLRTADETQSLPADRILYLDEEYEVVAVDDFTMTQMPHLEAIAVRVDRSGVDVAESPA